MGSTLQHQVGLEDQRFFVAAPAVERLDYAITLLLEHDSDCILELFVIVYYKDVVHISEAPQGLTTLMAGLSVSGDYDALEVGLLPSKETNDSFPDRDRPGDHRRPFR